MTQNVSLKYRAVKKFQFQKSKTEDSRQLENRKIEISHDGTERVSSELDCTCIQCIISSDFSVVDGTVYS